MSCTAIFAEAARLCNGPPAWAYGLGFARTSRSSRHAGNGAAGGWRGADMRACAPSGRNHL